MRALVACGLLLGSAAAGCVDEEGCSLNGDCVDAKCVCDPGWKGERCQLLNLVPPDPAKPHGYYNKSMPTWSGDAIWEDGQWHLIVTAKADMNSPYDNYMCNTRIVRLTGPTRAGPFGYAGVVLDTWHHEAHAVRTPDGHVAIYMLAYDDGRGGAFPNVNSSICSPGRPDDKSHCYPNGFDITKQVVTLAWSKSVKGPYQQRFLFDRYPGEMNRTAWDCQDNCPSVVVEEDGTSTMAFVGRQCPGSDANNRIPEKIGVMQAPHWMGPFTKMQEEPVFGWSSPAGWPPMPKYVTWHNISNEDPYLWKTKRGWHMIMHSMMGSDAIVRGIYGFSKDLTKWTLNPDEMWSTKVTWTNGTTTEFFRRQCPTLYVDDEGYPTLLQTAVDNVYRPHWDPVHPEGGCWWGAGWTFIQEIGH